LTAEMIGGRLAEWFVFCCPGVPVGRRFPKGNGEDAQLKVSSRLGAEG
jgi:hypothetical protein